MEARPPCSGTGLHLSRNFHFGLPNPIQYRPNRHHLVRRVAFFLREPSSPRQGGVVALPGKSKTAKPCLFSAFHKHLSGPHLLAA